MLSHKILSIVTLCRFMNTITPHLSNKQILELLGERIRAARLNQNLTQQQLAAQAGISESMLRLAEKGKKSLGLLNLIAILRALSQLSQLDTFLPEPAPRPEAFLAQKNKPAPLQAPSHKPRQRASSKRHSPTKIEPWNWGDNQP